MAVRWGQWKLWKVDKAGQEPGERLGALLPEVDYPPVSPNGQLTVLYDLSADIGEQQNLAEARPEIVERLEGELQRWSAELAEPLWTSRRSTLDRIHGEAIQLYF